MTRQIPPFFVPFRYTFHSKQTLKEQTERGLRLSFGHMHEKLECKDISITACIVSQCKKCTYTGPESLCHVTQYRFVAQRLSNLIFKNIL